MVARDRPRRVALEEVRPRGLLCGRERAEKTERTVFFDEDEYKHHQKTVRGKNAKESQELWDGAEKSWFGGTQRVGVKMAPEIAHIVGSELRKKSVGKLTAPP